MSLIDTIKNIFCKGSASQAEENKAEPVEATAPANEATEPAPAPEPTPEPVAEPEPEVISEPAPTATTPAASNNNGMTLPEDSALRRHFISQLKSEIMSDLPDRPTDSTLKRHYDAQVDAEIAKRLSN